MEINSCPNCFFHSSADVSKLKDRLRKRYFKQRQIEERETRKRYTRIRSNKNRNTYRITILSRCRANKRNNGAQKTEIDTYIHTYIYIHIRSTCQFPLTPSPSSIVRQCGPGLREDRHTTLCVSDQGNNRTRGRRTEDEEEWTARSCAREAATENTDTFRDSYFSHPAHRRPIFKPMPPPHPSPRVRGGKKTLGKTDRTGTPLSSTLPDLWNAYRFLLRYLFPSCLLS